MNYQDLIYQAQIAHNRAYVPYSQQKLGVSLLTNQNNVYLGCSVEIANFASSLCPVALAVGQAILACDQELKALALYPKLHLSGNARQLLIEFNPLMEIVYLDTNQNLQIKTLNELLPYFFGPKDLNIPNFS